MLQDYCPGAVDDSKGTAERSHFLQAPACNAFAALKAAIASHPVLRMPNPQLPFTITCDASDVAVGAVLEQDNGHGPRPVAFISKKLSAAELNYAARDKELLGVTYSLQHLISRLRAGQALYIAHGSSIVAIPAHAAHTDGAVGTLGGDCC